MNTSYRQEEAAYLEVEVDGDVTLKVRTNTGAKVSGRFVVQGTPRPTNSGEPISNVVLTATSPPGRTGPSYATDALVHPQGTDRFELTGLRGPMILHAQMAGALLASISRAGGEDLAGKPLDFVGTESIDNLLVVLTHDRAEVEVTLTGLREADDPEKVLVILFSEEPTRWHAGSLQYTVIEASPEMRLQKTANAARGPDGFLHSRSGPWFRAATSLPPYQIRASRFQLTATFSSACARSRYRSRSWRVRWPSRTSR